MRVLLIRTIFFESAFVTHFIGIGHLAMIDMQQSQCFGEMLASHVEVGFSDVVRVLAFHKVLGMFHS